MYNINPFPPPFGVCSICQKHDCGVSPEGEKWIQIPLELFIGGDIHIGYNCIKSMSDNMGITQEVVEREVLLTPTDEQIGDYVRKSLYKQAVNDLLDKQLNEGTNAFISVARLDSASLDNREKLKRILDEKGVKYFKGASDEVLAELVAKND